MVKYEYEKQLTYQCKRVQTQIDNFFKRIWNVWCV
jgi:hypothetical protein